MARYIRYLLLLGLSIGCMPKIEDDVGIEKLLVTNHSVNKVSAVDTDIVIEGTYPSDVTKIYIAVDSDTYVEVQKNSASARVLGVATATFGNGTFRILYPVPNPFTSRTIVFKIRGGNSEGRQGQVLAYEVSYTKPASALPGFAVVSTGGLVAMGPNFVLNSVGQSVSPYRSPASANGIDVSSGGNVLVRYGLIGVLLEQ
ncbi:MAG: hypothetical protein KDD37_00500 [Bdellovibrionales bacterium]|nr:hypothetical protein [Bdellovibrionales bacterium]